MSDSEKPPAPDDDEKAPSAPAQATAAEETAAEEEEKEGEPAAAAAEEEPTAPEPERVLAEPGGPAWLPLALSAAVAALFFLVLPPLTKSGLWDPYELNVADLSRRIALNLHGASALALEATDNSLPHLNDLGRPQLPFTSIALGFKLFGLHEWSGRLPLAIWGIVGVLVTFGFVARLVDRRAALFSAVALTTMPLYFVHARTMLGDIVMMTSFAMIFGGFAVAVFGRREDDTNDTPTRVLWLALALVGCAAGFFTRGAFIGVGVPALAVAVAHAIAAGNGQRFDGVARAAALTAGAIGLVFCYLGLRALGADKADDQTVIWAGALLKAPNRYPTFDFIVGHVAPSLAPWSAFAPFAIGRLFAAPPLADKAGAAFARESQARLLLLVGGAAALVAHAWIAARVDLVTFSGPAVIAAVCGIALRDYERGAHPSLAVGVGTAVLLGCMHHELHNLPEKAFQAFSVAAGATFPESFKAKSLQLWTIVLVGFAGISFLTWVERDPEREPFEPKGYLRVVLALRDAWDGMLALAYFAIVAGASLAGLAVWFGTRQHAKWLPTLSSQMRELVLNAWWLTAFAPLAVIFAVYFWSDVWVWAFDRAEGRFASAGVTLKERIIKAGTRGFEPFEELAARLKEHPLKDSIWKLLVGRLEVKMDALEPGIGPVCVLLLVPLMYLQVPGIVFAALYWKLQLKPIVAVALAIPSGVALFLILGFIGDLFRGSRAAFLVTFGVTVGAVLCVSFYPALANQLSPKEIFESYQRVHKTNEPLALFGVGGRTAAYYAGGQPIVLKDTASAYEWLAAAEPGTRRFAAVRADELGRLNRTYRERTGTGQNLPVLDARSSQIILVASSLAEGEKNQNPLGRIILSAPPAKVQRRLDANLEDKLAVLGYDIVDANGRMVESVSPGKKYHMRTYLKVLQNIGQEWQMFIHIDGFHRRHNGDHVVCEGKYPMTQWLKDDLLMDDHEFSLEPNFSPGPYTVYFGFFIGETRLKTKTGGDNENRVNGGTLRVQ
ncbi:MAG: glycosyltransferase family 39 protein [Labilithrix sp.]|nr:glycosyltransferase family 39 protein [Labilithrix sp.]MCW5816286.1 glycosyltransferase family 39 protein [Labilithrix sp.]